MAIQISGTTVIDNSRNLINTNVSESILVKGFSVSSPFGGGRLICKASSVGWIVAPLSSEVIRNWYSRNDANTRAQQVSGCTGWFVPTCGQLKNPGYSCRNYWDCFSPTSGGICYYWSNTEVNSACAFFLAPQNGFMYYNRKDTTVISSRAFRCVTY